MTLLATLLGARVRRIDAPSPDLWAVTLGFGQTRGSLIFSLHPHAAGAGWVYQRPHGQAATGFVQKLRKELEGGRIQALSQPDARTLELVVVRAEQPLRLAFDFETQNVRLFGADGGLIASLRSRPSGAAEPAAGGETADAREAEAERESAGPARPSEKAELDSGMGSATSAAPVRNESGRGHASQSPETTSGGPARDPSGHGSAVPETQAPAAAAAPARDVVGRGYSAFIGWPEAFATLEARGAALLEARGASLLAAQRAALLKGVDSARKRLQRKLAAVAGDAARAEQAPSLRHKASLLLSSLHAVPRGATSVSLMDYTLDPPAELVVQLDPTRGAREQAEGWFKQARRFERGATLAAQRLAAGQPEIDRLIALRKEIEEVSEPDGLRALAAAAELLGIRPQAVVEPGKPDKRRGPSRHVPYRTLRGSQERTILVGKGAADNDALTVEHARPQDLWLHARDVAGAHVVVPLARGETCPAELLIDAAMLAAHFSESRKEGVVDVSYTARKYVRKPKGSAVGAVVVEREKVKRVVVDPGRLAELLATQRDT
jgi:predicted ribosome quality control (RQC) complex YloA/Tae2 family protein